MNRPPLIALLLIATALSSCSTTEKESEQTITFPDYRSVSVPLYVDDLMSPYYGSKVGSAVLIQRRVWLVSDQGWWAPATASTNLYINNETSADIDVVVRVTGLDWSWTGTMGLAPGELKPVSNVSTSFNAIDYVRAYVNAVVIYPLPVGNG